MNDLYTVCDADYLFKSIINNCRSDFDDLIINDKTYKAVFSNHNADDVLCINVKV